MSGQKVTIENVYALGFMVKLIVDSPHGEICSIKINTNLEKAIQDTFLDVGMSHLAFKCEFKNQYDNPHHKNTEGFFNAPRFKNSPRISFERTYA